MNDQFKIKRTVEQWLNCLPKPYKKKALFNMNRNVRNILHDTPESALIGAFIFEESKEKAPYWNQVYYKLMMNEIKINTANIN